ncbi:MAG: ATP-binding protein [Nitrosopumilaceae archaeon]
MKLKTKFSLEVILLIGLIGMVSSIAIVNTITVQDSFLDLSSETLPTWDALKDMRLAASLVSSTTSEIVLIQDDLFDNKISNEKFALEEQLEFEMFEMETSKSLFTEAFTRYSILMAENFPENNIYGKDISKNWNDIIITSSKMISLAGRGGTSQDILELKNQFAASEIELNKSILSAMSFIEPFIEDRKNTVETLVDNTTFQIIIALNVFIASTLGMKYIITKSISRPLIKLRRTTHKIAEGEFIKANLNGDDEISELGKDIDKMSTDLEKLNREIITSERLSSIGSLASRLAHDLRNPLSVIKNSMEILKMRLNENMDEKINHQLSMVGRAVSRMSHQIEDVLDFVNIAALKVESNSIITIIESAILNTDIPKTVKVNLPKNSATAMCDPFRLEVVFSNLLKNACQAVENKGEIAIRIIDKIDDVVVELEDTGPGISEGDMDKIFEPLFTTKQTGTGLGLASCTSIINKHGGTLSVRNNPTTFVVTIPKVPKKTMPPKNQIEKPLLNE